MHNFYSDFKTVQKYKKSKLEEFTASVNELFSSVIFCATFLEQQFWKSAFPQVCLIKTFFLGKGNLEFYSIF